MNVINAMANGQFKTLTKTVFTAANRGRVLVVERMTAAARSIDKEENQADRRLNDRVYRRNHCLRGGFVKAIAQIQHLS